MRDGAICFVVSAEERHQIERAAAASGVTLSAFVRTVAVRSAERALRIPGTVRVPLTEAQAQAAATALAGVVRESVA